MHHYQGYREYKKLVFNWLLVIPMSTDLNHTALTNFIFVYHHNHEFSLNHLLDYHWLIYILDY